jgi:hypothetical protein
LSIGRIIPAAASQPLHWHELCPIPVQDTLDRLEIQRQDAIYELFQTERGYIEDMQMIIEVI